MDPDVLVFAEVLTVLGSFGAAVLAMGLLARLVLRRTSTPSLSRGAQMDEKRFARLEEAVDAIAIEVERMAEAQRFTAKLMSERLQDGAGSRAGSGSAEQ